MALTVVVRSGDLKSQATITFDAPRIVIGRGDGCEIRLPDPSVSHRHASIRQRGTDYVVIDEGSSNGTFVGPVRLSPQAPRVIRSGDLVRVGRIWLELTVAQVLPTQNPGLITKEIALALVASSLSAEGELAAPRVFVSAGPDLGKELLLAEFDRAYALGRLQSADLPLSDPDASRRHVELIRRGTQLFVRDLGSKNGATLSGTRLEPSRDTPWPNGAVLAFGANEFGFEDPVLAALGEIEAGSDEQMRDDDSIDPPNVAARAETTSSANAERGAKTPPFDVSNSDAPIAEVPKRATPANKKNQGFRAVDVVIALVALIVIGLSLVGLSWLFRSP
ncbi:MAG TPA: FHA domain-containing protein [Polyangiaceae bacterium]|nr:FHA domain-containing protein [Polyangiaceae bacterium]